MFLENSIVWPMFKHSLANFSTQKTGFLFIMPRYPSESPLFDATERLLSAVDRLESGIQQVSHSASRDVHQQQQLQLFERENKALRQEQEQLAASLAGLQSQYEELKRVATMIYAKLEGAITRITKIVDNNT